MFIAIEGGDGSGKKTQSDLLVKYFESIGRNVKKISFPQYDRFSGIFSTKYLNAEYGEYVHPDLASLTYAIDRYENKKETLDFLQDPNNIVIADRYVASNLAHQGGKISDKKERLEFYDRLDKLEFGILGLPHPDKSIVLIVEPKTSQENVDKKEKRNYTDKKRDLHEADKNHLENTKKCYKELCEIDPVNYIQVNCMDELGNMRTIDDIHNNLKAIIGV